MTYEELRELLEKTADDQGRITREGVVEAASDEDHPLHDDPGFHWGDDTEAAYQHRLTHAGRLIRRVPVIVRRVDRRQARVPCFVRAPRTLEAEPGYVKLDTVEKASDDAILIARDELRRVIGILQRTANVTAQLNLKGAAAQLDSLLIAARTLEVQLALTMEAVATEAVV